VSGVSKINNLTNNELCKLVSNNNSISRSLTALDINKQDPRARKLLRQRVEEIGLKFDSWNAFKSYTVEDIREAAKTARCFADIMRAVGLAQHGGNLKTVKGLIRQHNIETNFDLVAARRDGKRNWSKEEIFCKDSKYHRSTLRNAVIRFGVIEYKCSKCGNDGSWLNQPLPLDIDHINGDNTNNSLDNLRFLCPNCHRQTPTWGQRPG